MTIQTAIEKAKEMRIGSASSDESMAEWLTELEQTIYNEVILDHLHSLNSRWWTIVNNEWHFKTYSEYRESTDELIAEDPYSMLYVYWLMLKIDLQARDTDINTSNALFENAYENYKRWYKQNHRTRIRRSMNYGGWYGC